MGSGDQFYNKWNKWKKYNLKKNTKKDLPLRILLAHDNDVKYHTKRAHRLARQIDKNPKIEVIYDEKIWKPNEKTSHAENIRRERMMVKMADITIRIVHSPAKTGENRHAGAVREILETIHHKKPIIQIFEPGARNSPFRTPRERNYQKKLDYYLEKGESILPAVYKGIKEMEKRGYINAYKKR
ncbi:MAG: hypothetical protein ACTSRP_16585 [Candidatus Helarchaeota archaeon]